MGHLSETHCDYPAGHLSISRATASISINYIKRCSNTRACVSTYVFGLPTSRPHIQTHTHTHNIYTHVHTNTHTTYTHYYYVYIIRRRPFCPDCPLPAPPVPHHGRPISPRVHTCTYLRTHTQRSYTHAHSRVHNNNHIFQLFLYLGPRGNN